ncbi:MAG: hypothetical protein M1833_002432 [Piccolia ochrophora]|nr:MAG: hypothetical protein M1833_002432 [Piccolia ochrophora]
MHRPRWLLGVEALCWRVLMRIGMVLHKLPVPRPPSPSFVRTIPSTVSPIPGSIGLHFYTPHGFTLGQRKGNQYPVVVNFHGGGFTLGSGTDDARWAHAVTTKTRAVVVSVDYRLAPQYPFPTAVDDGVDAILYLASHAAELGIDPSRMALSGFSSGGNLAFTVPLKLSQHLRDENDGGEPQRLDTATSSLARRTGCQIVALVAWYPSTDYTRTRAERRATNIRPDQDLPHYLTDLFDSSYLFGPDFDSSDPYLSPAVAPTKLLMSLPDQIFIYTAEFDQLRAETQEFSRRLEGELGKKVRLHMVGERPHAWDKGPNPFMTDPQVEVHYKEACEELRVVMSEPTALVVEG